MVETKLTHLMINLPSRISWRDIDGDCMCRLVTVSTNIKKRAPYFVIAGPIFILFRGFGIKLF